MNSRRVIQMALMLLICSCSAIIEKKNTYSRENKEHAIRSACLVQLLDSFTLDVQDTTMATISFDTAACGQSYIRIVKAELPTSEEEKLECLSMFGDCPFMRSDDDYLGYTIVKYSTKTLLVLVLKGTMDNIPPTILDCQHLTPMDSLYWRPQFFFHNEGEIYDPITKRYRLEPLTISNKDSVAIIFDGLEG